MHQHIYDLTERLLPIAEEIKNNLPIDAVYQPTIKTLKSALHDLHPAEIADILEALPAEERSLLWHLTNPEEDGEILLEVSEPVRESLIEDLDNHELSVIADNLDADDLVELSEDLPPEVLDEAIKKLDHEEQQQVREALGYEDDQVGSIMDFTEDNLITIPVDVNCETVLRYLRRFGKNERGELPRKLDKLFVVDEQEHLVGTLSLRHLLVSNPEDGVAERMLALDDVIYFYPDTKLEKAVQAFERYDLVSAPVVNKEMLVIGRITVDDIMDIARSESEEDMLNIVGVKDEDLFAPIKESLQKRGLWICINLVTAIGASRIVAGFEAIIQQIVALAALLPIIAGIAGNSGNQTITMIVRAMGAGQLSNWLQIRHLFAKEITLALCNGILWGTVIALIAYVFYRDLSIALLMFSALILNLLLAGFAGVGIPLLWRKLGFDPAMGSSVAITACTDCGGFFILLFLAQQFLLS